MNFKAWKQWQRNMPWDYRWFVWLILLRPLIDNFYYIKPVSPLVVAGILTPILCLRTTIRYNAVSSSQLLIFNIFAFFTSLSAVLMFLRAPGVYSGEIMLKVTLPVYLYLFLRRFIYNQTDLQGILYTFIIASYIAGLLLLYEIVFSPIQEAVYTRGIQRHRGGYADVMNYAIYMSLGMIASGYFHLKKIKIKFVGINNIYLFLALAGIIVMKITHVASYGVFAAIIFTFAFYSVRKTAGFGLLLVIIILAGSVYFGDKLYQERINPLIEKDLSVLEGERDQSMLLHGRVGRWERLMDRFNNASVVSKLFGTGFELRSGYLMGSGTHNDFLRILFVSGFFGIISYLLFLWTIWYRSMKFKLAERFLAAAAIITIVLYSITTTPSFYANFMYIFMSIMVFFTLEPRTIYEQENS